MKFKKHFSIEEAEKTLPYVKAIVSDILQTAEEIKMKRSSIIDEEEAREATKELVGQLSQYIREISEIGCFYKDWGFDTGLVDFPAIIEGEEVLLCWKSDEEKISYFHKTDSGFAGRQPIKKAP